MSETKWTSGEWLVSDEFNSTQSAYSGSLSVIAKDGNRRPLFVATIENADDYKANASLISSAPKLYRNVEMYVSLLDALIEDGRYAYIDRRNEALEALAKARGESCQHDK